MIEYCGRGVAKTFWAKGQRKNGGGRGGMGCGGYWQKITNIHAQLHLGITLICGHQLPLCNSYIYFTL